MIHLIICALLAIFGAVQTIRIGDLKAKLRMPELPSKPVKVRRRKHPQTRKR